MLSTEVIVAIITSGCAAISSVIGMGITYVGNNRMKQRDMQDAQYRAQQALINAKRDQQHNERQYLYEAMLKGIDASLAANEISLIALSHGRLNGNVEVAMDKVQKAQANLAATTSKAITHLTDVD